jgi:hypothetical protein
VRIELDRQVTFRPLSEKSALCWEWVMHWRDAIRVIVRRCVHPRGYRKASHLSSIERYHEAPKYLYIWATSWDFLASSEAAKSRLRKFLAYSRLLGVG